MTMFLSDAELTVMRAQVARMLPGTAIIQSVTTVSDGAGGWTESWTAVAAGTVACRVDPMGSSAAQASVVAGQEATVLRYQLTLPYDAPLTDGHRVVIGSNTYEVLQLDIDHSWNVSRRAIIGEIR